MPSSAIPVVVGLPAEREGWTAMAHMLPEGLPPVFRLEALAARHWACVAIEDELSNDAAAVKLAQACAAHGFTAGWSLEVPWESGGWIPAAHHVALSSAGFKAVSSDVCIGSCFVLVEASGHFAVASDGDLYWMLAGPQRFVEAATGVPITVQLQTFNENVESYKAASSQVRHVLATAHAVAVAACANHQTFDQEGTEVR